MRESDKVLECYHVAGGEDYLLKVYARDIDDYEHFLLNSLTRTSGIDKVKTMFVLSTLKRETAMPLERGVEGSGTAANGETRERGKARAGDATKRSKRR